MCGAGWHRQVAAAHERLAAQGRTVVSSARDWPSHGFLISLRGVYATLAISAPTVLDATLSRVTMNSVDERLECWSRRLLEQAAVELTMSGREHLTPGAPYVVMSDHQSHYDIPILFQLGPGGWDGHEDRAVPDAHLGQGDDHRGLRRDRPLELQNARSKASAPRAKSSRAGSPEGARSRTGELLEFKKGGFYLVSETALPVVPVAIVGSRDILSAHVVSVNKHARVHVSFGQPIHPSSTEVTTETRDALMSQVRLAIEEGMAQGRARLARSTTSE